MIATIRQMLFQAGCGHKPCGSPWIDVRWVLLCGLFTSPVGAQSGDKPRSENSAHAKATAQLRATKPQPNPEIDEKSRENERARVLYRIGSNAYKAGRVDESRQLLSEAWELCKSYDIAATLGQVEFELGHYVEANELLDYCIANFPPIESDERLAKMKTVREHARRKVVELVVETDCATPTLTIDEDRRADLRASDPIYVLPGSHELFLRCGEQTNRKAVIVPEAVRFAVRIDALPQVRVPAAREKPPAAPARGRVMAPHPGPPRWPVYVGGGLVAGQIAAAIGLKVASNSAGKRADGYLAELDGAPSACVTQADAATGATCAKLSAARSDEHSYGNWSLLALGTAAATAVATATYWIWADPFSSSSKSDVKSQVKGSQHAMAFTLSPWTSGSPSDHAFGLSVANAF